jgi:hypothetical protein
MARQRYAALICSGAFLIGGTHSATAQPQCRIICTYADHGGKPTFNVTTCSPNIGPAKCGDLTRSLARQFAIKGCSGEVVQDCRPGKVSH